VFRDRWLTSVERDDAGELMSILSGKVSNAKVNVLMAVQEAVKEALSREDGDYHLGPVTRALNALIDEVRKEK
jgi:hypothetical protein